MSQLLELFRSEIATNYLPTIEQYSRVFRMSEMTLQNDSKNTKNYNHF
jgi:hypothetical protein